MTFELIIPPKEIEDPKCDKCGTQQWMAIGGNRLVCRYCYTESLNDYLRHTTIPAPTPNPPAPQS